jgi:hypothetical protein
MPPGGQGPNAYFDEGRAHLRAGDWVEAIRSLAWSHDVDPRHVETYLALIEAYERCAEAERSADADKAADLLQQSFNVCRDLRDRRLPMTAEQQAAFHRTFVRVRDAVVSARRAGWTPPPPKDQVQTLFQKKPDGA